MSAPQTKPNGVLCYPFKSLYAIYAVFHWLAWPAPIVSFVYKSASTRLQINRRLGCHSATLPLCHFAIRPFQKPKSALANSVPSAHPFRGPPQTNGIMDLSLYNSPFHTFSIGKRKEILRNLNDAIRLIHGPAGIHYLGALLLDEATIQPN